MNPILRKWFQSCVGSIPWEIYFIYCIYRNFNCKLITIFWSGIETVAGLASAKSDQIENILYSAEPFKSKKKDDAHQQQANYLSKNPCNI